MAAVAAEEKKKEKKESDFISFDFMALPSYNIRCTI